MMAASKPPSIIHLQRGNEGALRDFHLAELPHALLAFLLLVQKFALAGYVAAVSLRRHILGQRRDRLTRNHAPANRRLDGDFKQLAGNQILQLFANLPPAPFCLRAMRHEG